MRAVPAVFLAVLVMLGAAACGDDGGAVAPDLSVEAAGPHAVGVRAVVLADGARSRMLPTLIFYPAEPPTAPAAGLTIEQLEDEPHRSTYVGLLADAPAGCPTRSIDGALDAALAPGRYPLVVVSHTRAPSPVVILL